MTSPMPTQRLRLYWEFARPFTLIAPALGMLSGGVTALGAGLYSIGIPRDSIVKYETALKSDQFLVMAHGSAGEVAKAKSILESTAREDLVVHQ